MTIDDDDDDDADDYDDDDDDEDDNNNNNNNNNNNYNYSIARNDIRILPHYSFYQYYYIYLTQSPNDVRKTMFNFTIQILFIFKITFKHCEVFHC